MLGSGMICAMAMSVIWFSSSRFKSNACIPASGRISGNVCISVHQRRYRSLLEALHLILSASAVQQAGELCVTVFKLAVADLKHWRTLDRSWNSFLEQSIGSTVVQSHLRYDGVAAAGLTHDRDIVRVTSERSDVSFTHLRARRWSSRPALAEGSDSCAMKPRAPRRYPTLTAMKSWL